MEGIREIAEEHDLAVIEDACQAHGAEYRRRKVGSIGDIGCFSFYPTKNMTTGEGGMLTTDDEKIAEKTRMLRQHGMKKRYHQDALGFNYRMTDIAAAIGLRQLKKLDGFNRRRVENAEYLTEKIRGIEWLKTPTIKRDCTHVFHQYTIRVDGKPRDRVLETLRTNGIGAEVYYPIPIHKQAFYAKLGYKITLPETENCARKVLSLPIHPNVSKGDLDLISETLRGIR
jgi:dTDP-4-amino-4,6-dideoxygalactose transaminase